MEMLLGLVVGAAVLVMLILIFIAVSGNDRGSDNERRRGWHHRPHHWQHRPHHWHHLG